MRLRVPFPALVLLLAATPGLSKKATSFCKCICGDDSEIIALNSNDAISPRYDASQQRLFGRFPLPTPQDDDEEGDGDKKDHSDPPPGQTGQTCNDCTRQFCLDNSIRACKTIPEADIVTSCFQRDSSKDQAVVLLFIITTASLLAWATVRPLIAKMRQVSLNSRTRNVYAPVSHAEGDGI